MSIPLELITLFGSSALGCFMRLWGANVQSRRLEHMLTLQALNTRNRMVHQARTYDNKTYQWTRRTIALIAVFFIIAYPKIVAVFFPEIAVHVGYTELTKGLFSAGIEKTKWVSLKGLVITPIDTHLLAAIIGLYFGGALIGNR